jgi:hypothetical protein
MKKEIDDIDKLINKLIIGVFIAVIITITIISYIIHQGEEDLWLGLAFQAFMESLMLGIIFFAGRKKIHETIKPAILEAQKRELDKKNEL